MTTLNQIVAVEAGAKNTGESALTAFYHALSKHEQWTGLAKTYAPRDEDGERLPSEGTLVQLNGYELLGDLANALTRMFDVTATKDDGNTRARADVVVDGEVILSQVSVPTLLYLEKKLDVLATTVLKRLPVLAPDTKWTWDEDQSLHRSEPVLTTRSKKIPRNHEKAPATDKHAAQVEVYFEDVVVGDYTRTDFSGAFTAKEKKSLLDKVQKLAAAVKQAREQANMAVVEDVNIGKKVFEYLGWI
jgi:hypothetical protein